MRIVLLLAVTIISCLAAPGERVKRYHDIGNGGFGIGGGGGGYGGYGQHGGGGYGQLGGYGGHVAIPVASNSYSRSSASSSSVSTGGNFAG